MVTLIASRLDPAAMNMAKHLEEKGLKIHYVDEEIVRIKELPPTKHLYIVLSKHRSEAGTKSLTAHFTGNFSEKAEVGGNPRQLGMTAPSFHKEFMCILNSMKERVPGYEIVTEPTHHGPTHFDKPLLFVEIGSSQEQWNDEEVGKVMAEAVERTVKSKPDYAVSAIAFGGPHYSEKFTEIITTSADIAIGHILPRYASDSISIDMMDQMIERTIEKVNLVLIEKKMPQKERIITWANSRNLQVEKV